MLVLCHEGSSFENTAMRYLNNFQVLWRILLLLLVVYQVESFNQVGVSLHKK